MNLVRIVIFSTHLIGLADDSLIVEPEVQGDVEMLNETSHLENHPLVLALDCI